MPDTDLPPNAYVLLDDYGDILLHPVQGAFPTLAEAIAARDTLTRRPGVRNPTIAAGWAWVDHYCDGGPRVTHQRVCEGSMSINYGPDSTDPHRAAWAAGTWAP